MNFVNIARLILEVRAAGTEPSRMSELDWSSTREKARVMMTDLDRVVVGVFKSEPEVVSYCFA